MQFDKLSTPRGAPASGLHVAVYVAFARLDAEHPGKEPEDFIMRLTLAVCAQR